MTTSQSAISRRTMQGNEHLSIQAAHLPNPTHVTQVEMRIYGLMRKLSPDYTGGCWDFIALSNGAWFMEPLDADEFTLHDSAGREERMSAEAAGIAVMLYLLNHMTWDFYYKGKISQRDGAQRHFDALMAYARLHPHAGAIYRVLD